MKKKLYIIIAIILLLTSISLYYTYAIDVTIDEVENNSSADLTFNINIENISSRDVYVKAGETKYFDVFITNPNEKAINYELGYTNIKIDGITIAQLDTSKNKVSELIGANTTHQISLFIKNETEQDYTYSISPIVGYEKGGDLIEPVGYNKITEVQEAPIEPNNLELVEGLIPVTYSENKWVKANSNNIDSSWYNYDLKRWANAVLVNSSYRNSDGTDKFKIGEEIPEEAILAYYVWIPRYKYRVWNINKQIGVDSYDAYNTGIDIIWERDKKTTGSIRCNEYDFSITDGSMNEVCVGSNGEYYTHPAFTFGDTELRGIWVGKFEISTNTDSTCHTNSSIDNCSNITLKLRIKPNVNPWKYNYLTNFSYVIQNMDESNNEYGLNKNTTDSHMIKNIEWGSVAYLTHSKYGRCSNGSCVDVNPNTYFVDSAVGYKTGCGSQSETSTSYVDVCNTYNSDIGMLSSTTGNIYGIYDMSGGAHEFVMANMSSTSGYFTYFPKTSVVNFSYSETTEKYLDTYSYYNEDNYTQTTYNRSILGDGIAEIVVHSGANGGWYNATSLFIYGPDGPWFGRGGNYQK